jgi:hypothetical protein
VRRPGAAGQQVGLSSPELAGAAPGEEEPEPAALDEPVHLVQEPGQLLDLVDGDPRGQSAPISDEAFEQARVGGQAEDQVRTQEIDHQRPVPELRSHQEALARGAGAQQEEGLPPKQAGQ